MASPKKRVLIIKGFRDIGTGKTFTAGSKPLIAANLIPNYEAAGLVRPPLPTKKARAAKSPSPAA